MRNAVEFPAFHWRQSFHTYSIRGNPDATPPAGWANGKTQRRRRQGMTRHCPPAKALRTCRPSAESTPRKGCSPSPSAARFPVPRRGATPSKCAALTPIRDTNPTTSLRMAEMDSARKTRTPNHSNVRAPSNNRQIVPSTRFCRARRARLRYRHSRLQKSGRRVSVLGQHDAKPWPIVDTERHNLRATSSFRPAPRQFPRRRWDSLAFRYKRSPPRRLLESHRSGKPGPSRADGW